MIHTKYNVSANVNGKQQVIYSFWVDERANISDKDGDINLDCLLLSMVNGEVYCEKKETEDDEE